MATNEILPFCGTDTGTNLLTQAEYDADSQRPIGNQPGVARSKLVNKVLKQSSLLASALAQYLADKQATDITDDLTPSAIAALIDSVISAAISVPDASTSVKGIIQLATAVEARAAEATKALTGATGQSLVPGWGQAWVDVSGSRTNGTNYTNSTGKPICVSIYTGATVNDCSLIINGVTMAQVNNENNVFGALFGIVPNGGIYSATGPITSWRELR